MVNIYEFKVTSSSVPTRLDTFLASQALSLSRSRIKKLIELNLVKINNSISKPKDRLRDGDVVEIAVPEPQSQEVIPEDIPLNIIYSDNDILVIDKPAGLVVHPSAGHDKGTLVNALAFHFNFICGVGEVSRPGIVHRLDKNTSGLLVVAKNNMAQEKLSMQFKKHLIKKRYLTLVYGRIKKERGSIKGAIGRNPVHRKKMAVLTNKGKYATTHYTVKKQFNYFTLLQVNMETGRTHQIRVHFASIGHHVVMDTQYGNNRRFNLIPSSELKITLKKLSRQFLHAEYLRFVHPGNGKDVEFISPLPDELKKILELIEKENC
ncbi:MAG: RluA family pseudouridine synthase [Thermodesulfobacteriota bacterium]|nr:RluA family pseudouridine synthase [Thermodesulfobacteriota bacterium]